MANKIHPQKIAFAEPGSLLFIQEGNESAFGVWHVGLGHPALPTFLEVGDLFSPVFLSVVSAVGITTSEAIRLMVVD